MAVTRSWAESGEHRLEQSRLTEHAQAARRKQKAPRGEFLWLLSASILVAAGLAMVFASKSYSFAGADRLVNLNTVASADELLPLLAPFANRDERALAAERTFEFLERSRPLANIGALAALRVTREEADSDPRWDSLRKQFQQLASRPHPPRRIPLLPIAKLKPFMIVRTPVQFRSQYLKWVALYFAGFYVLALVWRLARFGGDRALLPALQLLTGIGLMLMISMRDPLRDTLEFHKFALGVFLGCLLLAAAALPWSDYRRLSDWCYTPLFAAIALFGLLLRFGRGPAGNDAKVNLGPFQPVELIKILLVIFLAGYCTRNWERLRDLRERRLFPKLFRRIGLNRLEHVAPVGVGVAVAVAMFFVLKDLGPALVTIFLFLSMFSVARGRFPLALAGLVLMVAAVFVGYRMGQPKTVVERIDMWLSPWDNDVHGGNQLAHSIWAFSTGGPTGSGPGWGDPEMIPAGNTDLVLPAVGEEWGFAGVAAVILLLGFLVSRAFRAAARAETHFGFFLALGLACLIAYEMLLISSGVLGLLPLSGVVSPFVSSGNTAMLANFLIFAIIAAISADRRPEPLDDLLRLPLRSLTVVLAVMAAVLVGAAARYQVFQDRQFLARDANSFEEDGVKRPQHNPRLNSIAREIPRGTIYDRNGIPLATGSWEELERHRAEYEGMGISIETVCARLDSRHYPFGSAMEHVTGDLRTAENFHATNASLVEHDSNRTLQGYDFAELAGLVRYRHEPGNPAMARVLARDRNVHLTLDARLQLKAREILLKHMAQTGETKGAVVVMSATTGDVLALVSEPEPEPPGTRTAAPTPDELLDRTRYGQYPPGSTFKLVTAIAALRANPGLTHRTYLCHTLPDGRCGNTITGWNRPIKDDIGDRAHGTLDMGQAIAVSCNAYFAQLGVHDVGSDRLADTAARLGIDTGDIRELRKALPFAAYGQGPVLISPFKMARVAATIAAGGRMPEGRWISGTANPRNDPPLDVLPAAQAGFLAVSMRRVVTEGTARNAMAGATIAFAGKTGTAQLEEGMPHSWFAGFAPYDGDVSRRIAFAVVVEHGGYGARVAAPVAREVMEAAAQLGILP
ncbi:MAG: FtsW/RodA/SpoVE family cell cycle protein [Bryobacteraceae bacterium]|jgi:cell division protein FtsI/penicillin-binding protein 2/cell division protein FtsW (lipid II flippase)